MHLIGAPQNNNAVIWFGRIGLEMCNICHATDLGHQGSQKVETQKKNRSKSMKMRRIYGQHREGHTL